MKKYSIEVMEILSRVVDVEAVDENDAIERVRQMYRNCQIVLDDSDYKEKEISVKDEKSEYVLVVFGRNHYLCTQLLILIIRAFDIVGIR